MIPCVAAIIIPMMMVTTLHWHYGALGIWHQDVPRCRWFQPPWPSKTPPFLAFIIHCMYKQVTLHRESAYWYSESVWSSSIAGGQATTGVLRSGGLRLGGQNGLM